LAVSYFSTTKHLIKYYIYLSDVKKDLTFKAKAEAKHLTFKAKAKDLIFKGKSRPRPKT